MRRRLALARHVLAHARFADVDAEFEQFPMDARRTPERIIATQLPNEFVHILRNAGSSGLPTANFPGPEHTKTLAVPANDCFRLEDEQGGAPINPNLGQPGPQESIGSDQFRPLHRATQDTELVPERKVFQLQGGSRFEARRCGGGQEMKQA